jgi:hypothetical protein
MGLLTKTDKATHAGHSNDRWTDREITMTAATQTIAIRTDQSGAASTPDLAALETSNRLPGRQVRANSCWPWGYF